MFFHGAEEAPARHREKGGNKDKSESRGDGLHHHEIHEDEAGGYHSKHTHPDGREEHGDHATYDEAKRDQDEKFGHGAPDDDVSGQGDEDMDADDVAGSYGRASSDDED